MFAMSISFASWVDKPSIAHAGDMRTRGRQTRHFFSRPQPAAAPPLTLPDTCQKGTGLFWWVLSGQTLTIGSRRAAIALGKLFVEEAHVGIAGFVRGRLRRGTGIEQRRRARQAALLHELHKRAARLALEQGTCVVGAQMQMAGEVVERAVASVTLDEAHGSRDLRRWQRGRVRLQQRHLVALHKLDQQQLKQPRDNLGARGGGIQALAEHLLHVAAHATAAARVEMNVAAVVGFIVEGVEQEPRDRACGRKALLQAAAEHWS